MNLALSLLSRLSGVRGADCGRVVSPVSVSPTLAPPCGRINGGLVLDLLDDDDRAADDVLPDGDLDFCDVLCASAALDAPAGFPAAPLFTALLYRPLGSARPLRCPGLLAARCEALDDELDDVEELLLEELVELERRCLLRPAPLSGVPELSESVCSACDEDTVMMVSELLAALASAVAAGAIATSGDGEVM